MNNLAPIVLFVYNRPWHTKQTINALLQNEGAIESELIIYSDAAKSSKDCANVQAVRNYISSISGFKRVEIIEREKNWGLASSIIDGVTATVSEFGKVIVLEDDMVTSPFFLSYMNDALNRFSNDPRVISVHAYTYPVKEILPEAFFLKGADCWGWGTWKRGWDHFNADGQELLGELNRRELIEEFDFKGAYGYSRMLKAQIAGHNDSWAIRWYASAFLANKLTIYPGRSLVHNIGNDDSGMHCGWSKKHDARLSESPIDLSNILVAHSNVAYKAFECFFRQNGGVIHIAVNLFKKHFLKFIMNCQVKSHLHNWVPPIVLRKLNSALNKGVAFTGSYSTWEDAHANSIGYDSDNILDKVLESTLKVKNGEAVFERDSVLFDEIEYSWPLLSGLMFAAARNSENLKVLDFGGSLGSCYFQCLKFVDELPSVKWGVVEQSNFVLAGLEHIADDQISFFQTIEECNSSLRPNVVLLSSVLQYVKKPEDVLKQISLLDVNTIIIDRTPFSTNGVPQIVIQNVPPKIYSASYPMHIFSEKEVLESIGPNWRVVERFLSPEGCLSSNDGHHFSFNSIILIKV